MDGSVYKFAKKKHTKNMTRLKLLTVTPNTVRCYLNFGPVRYRTYCNNVSVSEFEIESS